MRHLVPTALLFIISVSTFGQNLKYSSDLERQAFEGYKSGNPDYIMMLVAASNGATDGDYNLTKAKIESLITALKPSKFEGYSSSKKIKKVFNLVQSDLLVKYQLENQFLEVFTSGKFNCVSSTAVYALLLDNFKIPYQIIEVPEHVYLVAQPDGQNIVMEGTDAQDGYMKLTEGVVKKQLGTLASMKVITEDELNSPDLGDILNDLYPSESIGLIQLVAIQYYNQSIYDYEAEKYLNAYENAVKANYLFSNPRYRAMAYLSIGDYLSFRNYEENNYGKYFAAFADMDTTKHHYEVVEAEFHQTCYSLLVENPNRNLLDSIYAEFDSISSAPLKENLDFRYNLSIAAYLTVSGYHKDARQSFVKALRHNTENTEALAAFCANILIGAETGHFPEVLDTLLKYEEMFPTLKNLNAWHDASANISLMYCYHQMGAGNVKNATLALAKFEDLMEAYPDIDVMNNNIGVTYCRVALNKYRSSKSGAQAIIKKGLVYAPGNPDLLRMQRVFSQ